MKLNDLTIRVPLEQWQGGSVRVCGSRVSLVSVYYSYTFGFSPEQTVQNFPTLKVADVYAIFAYIAAHRDEIDEYVAAYEREADELERQYKEAHPPTLTAAELRRRWEARRAVPRN